eukprot:411724_1
MQHIGLAFCIIIYGTKHVIGVDVPITCTPRNSPTTSGNPDTTTVSCNAGETMVSCGISGTDRIGGTYIDSSGVCTAYDYSSTANLFAVAHCCVFPTGASVTTSTVSSTTGTDVSASCPTGSQLTGCVGLRMSDDADLILGAYPGLQPSAPPPQTSSWISTSNTCNAVSNSPTTVQAVARCVAVSNTDYALTCETKAAFTNTDNFGTCNTDYDMMSCVGFTPTGLGLDAYFVTGSDTCWVQMDSHANQYASAICCRLVLTTLAPSETPSKAPTKIPTEIPTKNPTETPSKSPTKIPTQTPTKTPTQTPSKSPTKIPTKTPTETPTKTPTMTTESMSGDESDDSSENDMDSSYSSSDDDETFLSAAMQGVYAVDSHTVGSKNTYFNIRLSDEIVAHLCAIVSITVFWNIFMCFCFCRKKPSEGDDASITLNSF